jgi:Arc/MetJ-type ribon-helix-helix transcriptional regulator
MSEAIKLTIPDTLAKEMQKNVKAHGYSNMQEFALDAIRQLQKKYEEREHIALLRRYYRKQKITHLTEEERKKIFDTLTDEKSSKIFREFCLD